MNPNKRAARARKRAREQRQAVCCHHQERELEFYLILVTHFSRVHRFRGSEHQFDALIRDLSCGECSDYREGWCAGEGRFGIGVMDCMNRKLNRGESGIIRSTQR